MGGYPKLPEANHPHRHFKFTRTIYLWVDIVYAITIKIQTTASNTPQELQEFLSKNDNRSTINFIPFRVNGWIIWGIFP